MKFYTVLFGSIMILNLTGCTSAQEKKDEAQAGFTEEKTETLKEYKECINDSEGAAEKMAQCEALLKAVSALEGGAVTSTPAAPATPAPTTAPVENSQPAEAAEPTEGSN